MAIMKFAEVVKSTGNEVDFMKNVIAYITDINSAITCLDNPDDEYDEGTVGTSHIPTFRFSFNGKHILTISRGDALSSATGLMYASFINNGDKIASYVMPYMYRGTGWSTNGSRQFKMSYVGSPGICILNITSFDTDQSFTVLFVESRSSSYGSYKIENVGTSTYTVSNIFNISECTLYDTSGAIRGNFISRFAYKAQPGKVDYIKSSIYINNNVKQFDITPIYDCTEVSPGSTISLEDGAYLAVGPHQLVKVS